MVEWFYDRFVYEQIYSMRVFILMLSIGILGLALLFIGTLIGLLYDKMLLLIEWIINRLGGSLNKYVIDDNIKRLLNRINPFYYIRLKQKTNLILNLFVGIFLLLILPSSGLIDLYNLLKKDSIYSLIAIIFIFISVGIGYSVFRTMLDKFNRGMNRIRLNDQIENYDYKILINPNNKEAYYYRGILKYYCDDCSGAIKDFDKVIELDPVYNHVFLLRSKAKLKSDKNYSGSFEFNNAIEKYVIDIRLNPKNTEAYYYRGLTYYYYGDFKSAIKDFDKVIELDPENDNAYFNRGKVKIKAGKKVSGKHDIIIAKSLKKKKEIEINIGIDHNSIRKKERITSEILIFFFILFIANTPSLIYYEIQIHYYGFCDTSSYIYIGLITIAILYFLRLIILPIKR